VSTSRTRQARRIDTPNRYTPRPPARAWEQASELSADDVLQYLPIQRQVRHHLPQLGVLVLQLLQPLHFRRQRAVVLLLPVEIGHLADPRPAANDNPSAPCFKMNAFWASENFDAFIVFRSSQPGNSGAENSSSDQSSFRGADQPAYRAFSDQSASYPAAAK